MIESSQYKFEHGAMSIIQMGEELIGHPTTAINELIKNGYDADAFDYWTYFNYSSKINETFILCFDNGLGMDEKILFGNWLHPSISNKRLGENKSPLLKRSYLGSKGIGRLASMALGRYLTVITKKSNEKKYNWLVIDREKFRAEELLTKVTFPGGKVDSVQELFNDKNVISYKGLTANQKILELITSKKEFKEFTEGTLVIVEQMDNSVKTIIEKDFKDEEIQIDDLTFLRSLKILVTPLSLNKKIQDELIKKKIAKTKIAIANEESVFKVHFGINLLKENSFSDVQEVEILKHFDYRIIGMVDEDGNVVANFNCQRDKDDIIDQEFRLDRDYVLSNEGLRVRKNKLIEEVPAESRYSKVGSFFFDIRVYDRDPDSFEKLSHVFKAKTKKETTSALDKFLGLRISKSGFNVKPYGEEDKDWMEMGQMRVQNPTEVIGTNQILGNIFLFSGINDGLKEKTNREGFFENEAFINFKLILRAILLDLGKKRYKYRVKHNIGRTISSKFTRPDSIKFLTFLKSNSADAKLIKKAEEFIESTNSTFENFENSLSLSERLAALGSGLELVYHELAQPLSIMGASWYSLTVHANKIAQHELRHDILLDTTSIKNSLNTLTELQESLEPAIGRGKTQKFKVVDTFNKIISLLKHELRENNITVEIDNNIKDLSINSFEYVFWISFLNILNNAVYWLKRVDNRVIYFRIVKGSIEISNTSAKIHEGDIEAIFEYGVTLKQEKNATGLGLSFTRNMLSKIGYSISATNRSFGPAFLIEKEEQ
jgi:signal transduction histidine kinase